MSSKTIKVKHALSQTGKKLRADEVARLVHVAGVLGQHLVPQPILWKGKFVPDTVWTPKSACNGGSAIVNAHSTLFWRNC